MWSCNGDHLRKVRRGIMWPKSYKDYKVDEPLIQRKVEPSHGIIGCEMHEINGWGNSFQWKRKRKKGLIALMIESIFKVFNK